MFIKVNIVGCNLTAFDYDWKCYHKIIKMIKLFL